MHHLAKPTRFPILKIGSHCTFMFFICSCHRYEHEQPVFLVHYWSAVTHCVLVYEIPRPPHLFQYPNILERSDSWSTVWPISSFTWVDAVANESHNWKKSRLKGHVNTISALTIPQFFYEIRSMISHCSLIQSIFKELDTLPSLLWNLQLSQDLRGPWLQPGMGYSRRNRRLLHGCVAAGRRLTTQNRAEPGRKRPLGLPSTDAWRTCGYTRKSNSKMGGSKMESSWYAE